MRLFKPAEHLQAALKATIAAENPLEQITTIGRQLSYFGYLSLDMIVWVRPNPIPPHQSKLSHRILNPAAERDQISPADA